MQFPLLIERYIFKIIVFVGPRQFLTVFFSLRYQISYE